MLKTILDFVFSVARLFFWRKGSKRKFCPQCGALLRDDRPCGCNHTPAGDSPGSSGGDHDTSPEQEKSASLSAITGLNLMGVAGWCLFLTAFMLVFLR